jgi:hypothetical protein
MHTKKQIGTTKQQKNENGKAKNKKHQGERDAQTFCEDVFQKRAALFGGTWTGRVLFLGFVT